MPPIRTFPADAEYQPHRHQRGEVASGEQVTERGPQPQILGTDPHAPTPIRTASGLRRGDLSATPRPLPSSHRPGTPLLFSVRPNRSESPPTNSVALRHRNLDVLVPTCSPRSGVVRGTQGEAASPPPPSPRETSNLVRGSQRKRNSCFWLRLAEGHSS